MVEAEEIWVEKYRPKKLDEIVGQQEIISRLKAFVEKKSLPHMLFAGPAGTGKCLLKGTEVLTPTSFEKIEKVHGNILSLLPNGGVSAGDFAFVHESPTNVLIKIKTRSGRGITSTPEHMFPIVDGFTVTWKPASDVKVGEKIPVVSRIPDIPQRENEIDFITALGSKRRIVYRLKGPLAEKYGAVVRSDVIANEDLRKLKGSLAAVRVDYGQKNYGSRYSDWMKPVWNLTPELLKIEGYLQAEGSNWRTFTNADPKLVGEFKRLITEVFSLRVVRRGKSREYDYTIPRAIHYEQFMNSVFGEFSKRRIPERILKAPSWMSTPYLRAFFDGDGWVQRDGIYLGQKHSSILRDIGLLLLRLGIFPRFRGDDGRPILAICGLESKRNFVEKIGLTRGEKLKSLHLDSSGLDEHFNVNLSALAHEILPSHRRNARSKHSLYSEWVAKTKKTVLLKVNELLIQLEEQKKELNYAKGEMERFLTLAGQIDINEMERGLRKAQAKGCRLHLCVSTAEKLDKLHNVLNETEKEFIRSYPAIKAVAARACKYLTVKEAKIGQFLKSGTSRIHKCLKYLENLFKATEKKIKKLEECEEKLSSAAKLALSDFVYDEVVEKEILHGNFRVVDLADATNGIFLTSDGIPAHNTTAALCIARELFGDMWGQNMLELNASDERGIDVIRYRVKDYARTKPIGDFPYKIILLDESDALTSDAQHALRRTMEMYSRATRFILDCNYSNRIIDPIQSRCAIFRFRRLAEKDVAPLLKKIARAENIKLTSDAVKAIIYVSEGDMRRAINVLQAAAVLKRKVDEKVIYEVSAAARPKEVRQMLELALAGKFEEARGKLYDLIIGQGLTGEDILKQVHREIFNLDVPERAKIELIDRVGEFDFRLREGANERIQLEAMLAHFGLVEKSGS